MNQARLNYISSESSTHFAYLLGCQRLKGCCDAWDKIYSILSMMIPPLQKALVPDYSRSARSIYTAAMGAYVPIYKDLDILAYSMHGTSSERYPSWCPNWDLPRSRITLGGPIHTRGFAACDNEPPVAEFSDDSNTLWLKGFRVDDVQISDLQGTKSEFSWDRIRARLEANWDIQSIAQRIADTQGLSHGGPHSFLRKLHQWTWRGKRSCKISENQCYESFDCYPRSQRRTDGRRRMVYKGQKTTCRA